MILRVAIARAQPEADATASRIRARGHDAIIAPLLTIVPCGYDTSLQGAQALVFTSSNGVRAFPDVVGAQRLMILAVGDATAEAARAAGFANIHSADGDVNSLAALTRALLSPRAGKLLHIGGAELAGDLSGELERAGYQVERRVAYAATAASTLPSAYFQSLDVILFHSARAAKAFVALGAPGAEKLTAACISPNVAVEAAKTGWARLVVAPRPREDELLDTALAT